MAEPVRVHEKTIAHLRGLPYGILQPAVDADLTLRDPKRTATVIGFRIRIDRQVPGAHGIRIFNPFDRTPGDDTAVIPLDASPAAPSSAPWGAIGAGAAVILAALTFVLVRRRRRG